MTLKRVLSVAHLAFAVLYFLFVLLGKWAKRGDPDEGVFSNIGGSGFGMVAVALGAALIVLALMRLAGITRVLPGLGVEQLTVALGAAATLNLIAFTVGWLAVFPTGTGWAIPAAYFPASFIPQVGLLTLSAAEPTPVRELTSGPRRTFSLIALLGGIGVTVFPFLTWLTSGSVSLGGFAEGADDQTSGPRLTYILLCVGVIVVIGAAMRLRPQGLAEPGANLLHGHALFIVGLAAFLLPLATLISVFRFDGLSPGIGLWLALVAGAVLVGVALAENRSRGAIGA